MKQTFKKNYDKNSIVFNHSCLYTCRIKDVKTKNNTRASNHTNTLLSKDAHTNNIATESLLVRSYRFCTSLLAYIKKQKDTRADRRIAIANLHDILMYTQE